MKFCLWKITSLQLKEASCFSLSHRHMTAVCAQHAAFGTSAFATSVLSVSGVGGDVHSTACWVDLFPFSFLQPTAFARTHKIKWSAWWRHHGYLRKGMSNLLMVGLFPLSVILWTSFQRTGLKSKPSQVHTWWSAASFIPGSEGRWAAELMGSER